MAKHYNIAIGFADKPVDFRAIQAAFGAAAGWARYAPNCWIVSTEEHPRAIVERIRGVVSPKDSIFACEINLANHAGYLQKEIWDWVNERNR